LDSQQQQTEGYMLATAPLISTTTMVVQCNNAVTHMLQCFDEAPGLTNPLLTILISATISYRFDEFY
jgi:hypothetical protein